MVKAFTQAVKGIISRKTALSGPDFDSGAPFSQGLSCFELKEAYSSHYGLKSVGLPHLFQGMLPLMKRPLLSLV